MAMYRASSNTSFISIGGSLEGNRAREAVGGCGADGAFFLSGPESTEEEFGCMYLSFLSPPEVTGDHGTRSYALFEDRRGGQLDTLPWSSMSSKISKRPRKGARRILRLVETDLRLRGKTDHHTAPTTEERKEEIDQPKNDVKEEDHPGLLGRGHHRHPNHETAHTPTDPATEGQRIRHIHRTHPRSLNRRAEPSSSEQDGPDSGGHPGRRPRHGPRSVQGGGGGHVGRSVGGERLGGRRLDPAAIGCRRVSPPRGIPDLHEGRYRNSQLKPR